VVSEKKTVTMMARKAQKLRTMATKKIEKKLAKKEVQLFLWLKRNLTILPPDNKVLFFDHINECLYTIGNKVIYESQNPHR
jgi:hypothetical protein